MPHSKSQHHWDLFPKTFGGLYHSPCFVEILLLSGTGKQGVPTADNGTSYATTNAVGK
jgi:hypothetical protein